MNKLNRILMSAAAATLITSSAYAFQGFSFGIIGNSSDFTTKGFEIEGAEVGGAQVLDRSATTTHDASADYPSLFIEYTVGEPGGMGVTFGIEHVPGEAELGAKSRTDTTSDANETNQDDSTYTAKAEVSNFTTLYAEPTFQANEFIGVYLKGGISTLTVNTLESIASGTDSSTYPDEDIFGAMYGAGIKINTPIGLFLKFEATETRFESVKLQSTTGNKNRIEATPEATNARIALGFNF